MYREFLINSQSIRNETMVGIDFSPPSTEVGNFRFALQAPARLSMITHNGVIDRAAFTNNENIVVTDITLGVGESVAQVVLPTLELDVIVYSNNTSTGWTIERISFNLVVTIDRDNGFFTIANVSQSNPRGISYSMLLTIQS